MIRSAKFGQFFQELFVAVENMSSTGNIFLFNLVGSEPVTHHTDDLQGFPIVSFDIETCEVGQKSLYRYCITRQTLDDGLLRLANTLAPKKRPSSSGILNLGRCVMGSKLVRERSWIPHRHSRIS